MSRRSALALAAVLASGCAPVTTGGPAGPRSEINQAPPSPAATAAWADSVLATLTLREKAAQIVWPSVFGDYTSGNSPQWQRLQRTSGEKVRLHDFRRLTTNWHQAQRAPGMSRIPSCWRRSRVVRAFGKGLFLRTRSLAARLYHHLNAIGATEKHCGPRRRQVDALEGRLGHSHRLRAVLDVNNTQPIRSSTRSYLRIQMVGRRGAASSVGFSNGMMRPKAFSLHAPGSEFALPCLSK